MTSYRLSRRVEGDLAEALAYLGQRNPAAAARWLGDVDRRCAALAARPESGRRRDDLSPGLRCAVVDRWLIFYKIAEEGIEVSRILHGARDLAGQVYG